ncbi:hypothetical protein EVC29_123 [Rhizobium phage RHph_Y52]|nr:hypothetical protein EVC16_123 [Rhizobium phage RHph_Y21]QIG76824.1 hypothetical protein EVC29_123 [Rhizobium phage RHph_Y52]
MTTIALNDIRVSVRGKTFSGATTFDTGISVPGLEYTTDVTCAKFYQEGDNSFRRAGELRTLTAREKVLVRHVRRAIAYAHSKEWTFTGEMTMTRNGKRLRNAVVARA